MRARKDLARGVKWCFRASNFASKMVKLRTDAMLKHCTGTSHNYVKQGQQQ